MNDNIKIINFNKNIINNKNDNISEIIFNNNNQLDENFLKNNQKNIIIEENVALENKELIYKDDSIYLQELENDLLSTYPVTKQSSKYIIEKVQSKAKDIINLKNNGLNRYNLLNKNIEYQKKLDIINNDFSDSWLIPIVYDNHLIFSNIIDKNIDENNELNQQKILTQLRENSSGYSEIEQKELLEELNLNNINFEEKKINITEYEEINSKLYKSFQPKYESNNSVNKGFLIHPKKSFNVLRYIDLKTNNWNTHKILNDLNTPLNIYDEDGKIIGIQENQLIKGEEQNIFGFLLLKEGNKNILNDYNDILFQKSYNNHLYQVLYNKKKIDKIYQTDKNYIRLTINDHKIDSDSTIYLFKTDCYPKIDGYYESSQNLKVIDKDNIEIKTNKNLIFEGSNGFMYILSKLKYDYYNTDENLDFNFLYTTYDNNIEDSNHNKIYIFEDIQINRKKYVNIINKILPSIDDIIINEKLSLENCYLMDEVNSILNKYYINVNDINNKHYEIILKYLNNNISKIEPLFNVNYKFDNVNYFFENKEYLNEHNYYLNDSYLFSNEIVQYYGEYPYRNKNFDSIIQRYNWLKSREDKGNLYIHLLNLKEHESNKNQLKYIENKIKDIRSNISFIEKNIKKDNKSNKCSIYKYSGQKINELNHDNKDQNNYYLFEDDLYVYLDNDFKKIEDAKQDDLLLLDNLELWVFKNKKWEFTNTYSKYNKIKYLCELKNIDISEIELDSLDCIYRKDFGCYSKTIVRAENKLEELKKLLDLFIDLEKKVKNKQKQKIIKNQIDNLKNKFSFNVKKNNQQKKINFNIKGINSLIPVDILVNKIFKLEDIEKRENYFYQLISKDCIFIDNDLYSKKFKKKILCGHYYYLKKIYYSNDDNLRQKYIDEMISIYSDQGEVELNNHVCKKCGEKLFNNEYDESEGYAASGALIISRETWVKEKSFEVTKQTIDEYLDDIKTLNCDDEKFKELLLKNGLSIDNLEKAINLCNFIVKTLYPKIGINLPNGVLITNIIEIIQKIDLIIPFQLFKIKEKDKLLKSGISQTRINKMEEKKYFEQKYKIYYEIKKQSIIVSRILISIQVNIPNISIKDKTTNCQFFSFTEKDGIEFFACILKEINQKMSIDKENVLNTYKKFIKEYYDEFKSYHYIRELFKEKKKYILSLKREKKYEKNINENKKLNFKEIPKKMDDAFKLIDKVKKYDDFINIYDNAKIRNLYVMNEIKEIIKDLISKAPLSDKLGGIIEKSCCSQDVETYIDFFQYFQLFNEETKILDFIEESKYLNKLLNLRLTNYNFHKIKLNSEDKEIKVDNTIVIYDGKNPSEEFKKSIFKYYVNEGIYKGTPRDYITEYSGIKNIKTGQSLDEIEKTEYSVDELNELLKSIEQNNLRFISETIQRKKEFDNDFIDQLKKESINGLKIQINMIINNLVYLLGKTKEYENSLYNLFNEIKRNEIKVEFNKLSIKEKINYENSMNNNRLNYFKKLYLKISKYLSIIKNRFEFDRDKKINLINNPKQRSEMKSEIIIENSKLDSLLVSEISNKFIDIEMKYSLDEINSIYGTRNVMDKNSEKTLKYSNFTTNDASNLMEYIFYEQLNLLFSNNQESELKSAEKSVKNKYVAQFINIIIEEMEEDYQLFEICNKNDEFEHLDARFYNAYQLKIITSDQKYEIKDFLKKMSNSKGVSLDTEYNTLEDDVQLSDEIKDISESITDRDKFDSIKQEYLNSSETDEDLDLTSLKEIKSRIDQENEEIEEEDMVTDGILKNKDIIDMGSGYGEHNEFDFETGEGFPDVEYE